MDAVPSSDVVGRRHHAPLLRRTAHVNWFADQFRLVAFLHRGVKGVHVAVENHNQIVVHVAGDAQAVADDDRR